jgi:hypothetical protein
MRESAIAPAAFRYRSERASAPPGLHVHAGLVEGFFQPAGREVGTKTLDFLLDLGAGDGHSQPLPLRENDRPVDQGAQRLLGLRAAGAPGRKGGRQPAPGGDLVLEVLQGDPGAAGLGDGEFGIRPGAGSREQERSRRCAAAEAIRNRIPERWRWELDIRVVLMGTFHQVTR